MNTCLKQFFVITVFAYCCCLTSAQVKSDDSLVPASSWKTHKGVISFAVVLSETGGKDNRKSMIRVYVKNTSPSVQGYCWSSASDQGTGLYIFTFDSNGIKHPLHDRNPVHKAGATPQERAQEELQWIMANSGSASVVDIAPGDTFMRTIVLSPAEVALVKSRAVQCQFHIINPKTSEAFDAESTATKLPVVETQ